MNNTNKLNNLLGRFDWIGNRVPQISPLLKITGRYNGD
jgi:hypothetical protein